MPDLIRDFNDLVGGNQSEAMAQTEVEVIENLPDIIEKLRKQMLKAADDLNFEEAAKLRDRIQKLEEMSLTDMA